MPLTLKPPAAPRRYVGLAISLVLHGLLLALLVLQGERLWRPTLRPGLPASRDGATTGGGSGGARVAYITLPPIPKAEAPPVPKAIPSVPPPQPVVVPAHKPEQSEAVVPQRVDTVASPGTAPALAAGDTTSAGGEGVGSGQTGSQGPGSGVAGGGNGPGPGGEGGSVRPPEPRDMAFPFDTPPKELRGISLNVTFWVRVDGKVERYTVDPEIKDRDYAKKFDEVMRAFRFTPARAPDGTRVPGTTRISFTLPGKSSS